MNRQTTAGDDDKSCARKMLIIPYPLSTTYPTNISKESSEQVGIQPRMDSVLNSRVILLPGERFI